MPYKQFDTSQLILGDLNIREHDLNINVMMDPNKEPVGFDHPSIDVLAREIVHAKQRGSSVLLMMGAHVIRAGAAPWLIKMMEQGLITHFALNGAGAIHDFEFAMIGATTESVAKYISEGKFGLWKQSGLINDIVNEGVKSGMGMGESLGKAITENDFPYKDSSLLAAGYKNKVPVTVHVSIGCDFIHQHPNFSGEHTGKASYTDFLIYTDTVTNIEGGVFLNIGSAVTGPEVYLKALSMARNVAHQHNRKITNFTTAVFDLVDIDDHYKETPSKADSRYYFRPWKTILSRTIEEGGRSHYIKGDHKVTVPNLAYKTLKHMEDQI